jgi:hypothetical protein
MVRLSNFAACASILPGTLKQTGQNWQIGAWNAAGDRWRDQSWSLYHVGLDASFAGSFAPAGIELVSWYVLMGICQIVTLRVPPSRLREVNRVIEGTAWGSYRTEDYPTYEYRRPAEEQKTGDR